MGLHRDSTRVWLLLAVLCLTGVSPVAVLAEDYDVLIRNGRLLDGSGAPWRYADIGIRDDRIVEVGHIPKLVSADLVIDASGRYVTPGFLDPHSHAVNGLMTPELAHAKPVLLQGITTVFINPDGGGPGDITPQLTAIAKLVPGVNVVPMIGHNGVRTMVMGLDNRKATADELEQMRVLVYKGMQVSFGFSSGPFYVPGKYSDTGELVELAKVAAEFPGAFHISHIRDESNYDIGVVAAVEELIDVTRQAGLPGVITHFKNLGPFVWGASVELKSIIDAARAEGLSIWADQYAYAVSGSGLQPALVPGWAQEGGPEAIARRLQDPEQRDLVRAEMVKNLERRAGADAILIRRHPANPALEGRFLGDIARDRSQDPLDTAIDMLIDGGAAILSFNMNDQDVERIMRQPWTMTSSDGALVGFGDGNEHPRAYGAFPRKIRKYVQEDGIITLEQMVHASTGMVASVLGIQDRGFIRPGAYADIIVFDPTEVADTATYLEPHSYSVGIYHVLVNGRPAVTEGVLVEQRHGRILKPQR